ncbi:MAG: hypothetical protein CFH38_00494, partial [Alphaproteobacteria bacterium MarineAlpha10_Bin1]
MPKMRGSIIDSTTKKQVAARKT